ncbi:MAG: amidohydrolase [Clostridiales bacterium]|nr:amidohydrolase [Clostridiales bacterium]
MNPFYEEVLNLRDYLLELRHDIHSHPELGWKETRTQALICRELDNIGIAYEKVCGTGVVAVIRGKESPVIGLRADMDALPIDEKSDEPYRSVNPGIMHACGHDCHVAILLGVAKILSAHREELRCTVKLIFQPAEECIEGARAMSQIPQVDDLDHIFAAHVWVPLPVGSFSAEVGPRFASADNFSLTVRGRSAHGANPHQSVDAVVAACNVVNALQTVVSRNVDPLEPLVVTIGTIEGGTSPNIIANEVRLSGTARSFDGSVRDFVEMRIGEIAGAAAAAYGAECDYTYRRCTPATSNYPEETAMMQRAVSKVFGEGALHHLERTTGGEDFSWFMERTPGAYLFIGAGNKEKGKCWPHHHECFDVDEDAIVNGAAVLSQLAFSFGRDE